MNRRTLGTVLGVVGVVLWFMPFAYVDFMGVGAYQTGTHIGGIAYLLLLASLAYAVLSWMEQHVPRIIAASVALVICLMFLASAGASAAWGLIALTLVSAFGIVLGVRDNQAAKASAR